TNFVNTLNATEIGDPFPTCLGCCPTFGRGVWYTLTPNINERVSISTCGSDFGTVLSVYTGTCGALTNFTCANQGGPSCNNQASLNFSGGGGTTYYIMAGGINGTGGNLQIVATLSPPPTNDTCAHPIALVPGVTNFLNTANATEFGDPFP